MQAVELAPIIKTLDLSCLPARAFQAFAEEMGAWWPLATHSRARDAEAERSVDVIVQPGPGGRIYETLDDGRQLDWGEVLTWEPGVLLEFSWHLGSPPDQATRVAVRFDPLPDAGCRVTLTHSGWERLGDAGMTRRGSYDSGWVNVFEACYGGYAGRIR